MNFIKNLFDEILIHSYEWMIENEPLLMGLIYVSIGCLGSVLFISLLVWAKAFV